MGFAAWWISRILLILPVFLIGWLPIVYFNHVASVPEYFERHYDRRTHAVHRADHAAGRHTSKWVSRSMASWRSYRTAPLKTATC